MTSPNNSAAIVSSSVDLGSTSWPYAVSERGCQSCQSATTHLSHKAIECDSKHSSSAKPILKNYLKASCQKNRQAISNGNSKASASADLPQVWIQGHAAGETRKKNISICCMM